MNEAGKLLDEHFDLVVLSVGMEISEEVRQLGRQLSVELDQYGFCHTVQFNPLGDQPGRNLRRRSIPRAEGYP